MDVGCFLGHDLRRLVVDGAPSTNLYGVDIVNHWEVGYDLFRDHGRFSAHFIEADILSEKDPALFALRGQVDIVSMMYVLHQWDWDGQVAAAVKLCRFARTGSMVVGCQMGNGEAGDVTLKNTPPQWRHNPASFQRLWEQVSQETGIKWSCQANFRTWEDMGWISEDHAWLEADAKLIEFVAFRA